MHKLTELSDDRRGLTKIHQVIALVVDLIGSTQIALEMTEPKFRRFNREVINQLWPYLKELDLEDSIVKFTGDGWLIFQKDLEKLRALVALAKILSNRFQADIAAKMEIDKGEIPDLRLAVALAYDDEIVLPNGSKEWVGDSARMATRASGCCAENEVIVSGSVRDKIRREFDLTCIDVENLPENRRPKRWEENFQIFSVGEIREALIADMRFLDDPSGFSAYAVYLRHSGRPSNASQLIREASGAIKSQIEETAPADSVMKLHGTDDVGDKFRRLLYVTPRGTLRDEIYSTMLSLRVEPTTLLYNALINGSANIGDAVDWFERMDKAGIAPNVVTFNTLINLSPDLPTAEGWFERMDKAGIAPNVVTFNTLINLSPDLPTAEGWFERMDKAGIAPNELTSSTLAKNLRSLEDADRITKKLETAHAFLGDGYYSTIYARLPQYISGTELLDWHFQQSHRRHSSLGAAIHRYETHGKLEDCFRVALAFPYFDSARKAFRLHSQDAINYYSGLIEIGYEPDNATYALGIYYAENQQDENALKMLNEALRLSSIQKRTTYIVELIKTIKARLGSTPTV